MLLLMPAAPADSLDAVAAQFGRFVVSEELPVEQNVYTGLPGRGEKIDFAHVFRSENGNALAVEMEPWEKKTIIRLLLVRGSKIVSADRTVEYPSLATPYDVSIGTSVDTVRAVHGAPASVDNLSATYGDALLRLMIDTDPHGTVLLYPLRKEENGPSMLEVYILRGIVEAMLVY